MMKIISLVISHSGFTDTSGPAVQRLLLMSSALRNFHYVTVVFIIQRCISFRT